MLDLSIQSIVNFKVFRKERKTIWKERKNMICNKCGKENLDGAAFCAGCGAPLQQNYAQPNPTQQVPPMQQPIQPQPQVVYNTSASVSEEYTPISMWGYFGYEILFSIPCVGLICLIVFSFASKNKNVKNFARSYFCFYIIMAVITAIILVATGSFAALSQLDF